MQRASVPHDDDFGMLELVHFLKNDYYPPAQGAGQEENLSGVGCSPDAHVQPEAHPRGLPDSFEGGHSPERFAPKPFFLENGEDGFASHASITEDRTQATGTTDFAEIDVPITGHAVHPEIHVKLQDFDLWKKLAALGTAEMMVTKDGR